MATLGLEEADSKMHVQRTGSGYEAVQTDVGAKIPNVQYSYRSLRRISDGQAGKKCVLPGEIRFDATAKKCAVTTNGKKSAEAIVGAT